MEEYLSLTDEQDESFLPFLMPSASYSPLVETIIKMINAYLCHMLLSISLRRIATMSCQEVHVWCICSVLQSTDKYQESDEIDSWNSQLVNIMETKRSLKKKHSSEVNERRSTGRKDSVSCPRGSIYHFLTKTQMRDSAVGKICVRSWMCVEEHWTLTSSTSWMISQTPCRWTVICSNHGYT